MNLKSDTLFNAVLVVEFHEETSPLSQEASSLVADCWALQEPLTHLELQSPGFWLLLNEGGDFRPAAGVLRPPF